MTYTDWFPGFDGGSMKQPTADLEVDNKTGIAITQDCIELRNYTDPPLRTDTTSVMKSAPLFSPTSVKLKVNICS